MTMIALWLACAAAVQETQPSIPFAANDELRAYLLEAAENHPNLKARHEEWRAMMERIPQVTALDDPMFFFGQFVQSDTLGTRARLSQKFPWFGTLKARGDRAAAEAEAALARLYNARNRIFADVKDAYFEYDHLGQQIRLTESQVDLLIYMEEIIRAKYSVGLVPQDNLLRIQIEKEKVQDRYNQFMQVRPALSARLNEALGRPTYPELPWPQPSAFPPDPPETPVILDRIHESNPVLEAFDSLIVGREKQIDLARRKGKPDFTLGAQYTTVKMNNLEDNTMLSLSLNLPIYRKRIKASIQEATHRRIETERDRQKTVLALETQASLGIFGIQDGQRRYKLFADSLIPKARQTYENLQTAYASGGAGASFLDVLDSIQVLLDFELEQIRAARDWQQAAAQLEFLMGGSWATVSDAVVEIQ